ncbi:SDR family oxidoreductase [Polaromonas hydrogenivorans]|uniref:SDR family oxidoreductase n=1 Tax=Polaromonas hydrogenivorans TaxID=335476 RepID=A0AAU7LXA3_9BURK
MKNVILIGANGSTARQIIPRLLEQEDVRLTLFLRRANRLQDFNSSRVNTFEGDARNIDDLKAAIKGQDVVVSTMGGMDLGGTTENVVKAMQEMDVHRIIAICAGGIYDELPEPFNAWDKKMVGHTRPANLRMAEVIEQSSLNYTILRPVWLTDKSTQEFELTKKGEVYKGTETSRASLGRFVADVVKNPALHGNENLGVSQPDTDGDKPAAYR